MAATAKLRLQIDEFKRNYKEASRTAKQQNDIMRRDSRSLSKSFAAGAKGMGANAMGALGLGGGVAGIGYAIKQSLQWADDIADLTQKLNENAEVIQRVDFVAKQAASVGVEQISKAMLKLEDNLGDVENTKVADALSHIGISAQDLIGLPLDEKLIAMSGAFQEARKTGVGVADMTELIGRQAGELIPLLNLSEEALESMFAEAPALADEAIQSMAALNDKFDAMVMKGKAGFAFAVDASVKWIELLGDIATNPFDLGGVSERLADKSIAAEQAQITREEAKKQSAAAVERQRSAKEEAKIKADALKDEEAAAENLKALKDELAKGEFDLLPDDEKLEAFRGKLAALLKNSVGHFGLNFEESVSGLEELAKVREKNEEGGPARSGVNSAAEAFQWLKDARQLQQERAALEKSLADKEKSAAEKKATELETARADAEKGEFELMNPEEQAMKLKEKLSDSLGFDIGGLADVERGLSAARAKVEAARKAGDGDAEKAALEKLNEAQAAAKALAGVSTGEDNEEIVNGRGTVAGAIANIFGRSSSDLQLDEAKQQTNLLGNIERVLREIRDEDDEDPFGNNFAYP